MSVVWEMALRALIIVSEGEGIHLASALACLCSELEPPLLDGAADDFALVLGSSIGHQKNYTRFRGHFEVAFGALILSRHFSGHF